MGTIRVILRGLIRAPLFASVLILSLALGIGCNTAAFSLLDQVLLRTLPVKMPGELVFLYHPGPLQGNVTTDESGGPAFSFPVFRELQRQQRSFVGIAAAANMPVSIASNDSALRGKARLVSGNYFELLGVQAAIGRVLTEDDDITPGGCPLVVLSHSYWVSRFGASPSAINRILLVNGYPMVIVGVTPMGFNSERLGKPPDIFLPITMKKEVTLGWNGFADRTDYWVTLVGRLKPGITVREAENGINVPYRAGLDLDINAVRQPSAEFLHRFRAKRILLKAGLHGRGDFREESRRPLLLLGAIGLLVLLIACSNVAGLQLTRSIDRQQEVAVRLAIGASRFHVIRDVLGEALILAVAGGVIGLSAGRATLYFAIRALPESARMQGYLNPELDLRVFLFALVLSITTGILFGIIPALEVSKTALVGSLKGRSSPTRSTNATRKILITLQIAVSMFLLITAGLFLRTVTNLAHVELGFRADHLITFTISPKLNLYTDHGSLRLHQQLTESLSRTPGISEVSAADVPALAGSTSGTYIVLEDSPGVLTPVSTAAVGVDYFRTMGVPIVVGREFNSRDGGDAPMKALVNEAFVRQYYPKKNPLGRFIGKGPYPNTKWAIEIVGVVKDAKYSSIRAASPPVYFTPLLQARRVSNIYYYLRTAVERDAVIAMIRRQIAAVDSNMPVQEIKMMQTQIDENTFNERMFSILIGTFAALATMLTATGLYALLSYNVARATHDIGIRLALGAQPHRVLGAILLEAGMMITVGGGCGLAAAGACGRLVEVFLYGMKPWDPFVYGSAALVLSVVAFGAAYMPARRATNVNPLQALRHE